MGVLVLETGNRFATGISNLSMLTKKKLSKILAFGMAPKKPKAKPPASKYQNFSDDDGEGEEGEEEDGVSLQESTSTMGESIASSSAASWKEVDAAIPVLQL